MILTITAMTNDDAKKVMEELGNHKGSEAHSSVIFPEKDKNDLGLDPSHFAQNCSSKLA
ncbi:hypothetical protein MKL29_02545 [Streptococcus suis]|nr:hypothetical protein [Streptococcus suis]